MQPRPNPLKSPPKACAAVALAALDGVATQARKAQHARRTIRDQRRHVTAAEAVAQLDQVHELYGVTLGQFSLVELIAACLDRTGPARLFVSAWTAAHADCVALLRLLQAGQVQDVRLLVDPSLVRRAPAILAAIRELFGHDAVRVTRNHAKWVLIANPTWRLVIRTSMNLNRNPRLEDYTIAHDPALADFLDGLAAAFWRAPTTLLRETAAP